MFNKALLILKWEYLDKIYYATFLRSQASIMTQRSLETKEAVRGTEMKRSQAKIREVRISSITDTRYELMYHRNLLSQNISQLLTSVLSC